MLSIHLERYVWFRGESPPLLVIIIYFFPNKRQGNSTSAVVTFHHVLPSIPRYNAFTTLLLVVYENRGKERGTSSPLELDQHFWKIPKQQSGRGSGSGSAGSAEIGGRGGRRLGSRCRGSGEGERDQILSGSYRDLISGTEFALCWTSSENGLKTCTPVVRSSSVVMAQNAELVSLLVDGCRYGDMEDVTEGENRRNRDPSHGRKGVCALQSDSGSDRSEN